MVRRHHFGTADDGRNVDRYVLSCPTVEMSVISYGAIVTDLRVMDRHGTVANVVLGYSAMESYLSDDAYLGAVIGRYANRIADGRFTLNGVTHQLERNDGPHHLHGGIHGFNRRIWSGEPIEEAHGDGVHFTTSSPAGEGGYPGRVDASVTYRLGADGLITVAYSATCDAATPLNLTQHSYFNLSGDSETDILDHELWIDADCFTPVDETLIPTGVVAQVEGTPFDFRTPRRIGDQLGGAHDQLRFGHGFDHNWVLNRTPSDQLRMVAALRDPATGRRLEISTTEPGLQFYAGQKLGRGTRPSRRFRAHAGLCLETQHFPDSPNHPEFPFTILMPGHQYHSVTTWKFAVA